MLAALRTKAVDSPPALPPVKTTRSDRFGSFLFVLRHPKLRTVKHPRVTVLLRFYDSWMTDLTR